MTFEEFAKLMLDRLVYEEAWTWDDAFAAFPDDDFVRFAEYVRSKLEPVDFMPSPGSLLIGTPTPECIEAKKQELRPKYVQLHTAILERLREIQGKQRLG